MGILWNMVITFICRQQMKMLGLDFSREDTAWRIMQVKWLVLYLVFMIIAFQGAEKYGRDASTAAHQDLALARDLEEGRGEPQLLRENMIVVKLSGGGLLLYCPVRVLKVRQAFRPHFQMRLTVLRQLLAHLRHQAAAHTRH